MTEAEWLTTCDPDEMLTHDLGTGGTEARKRRLAACAFVRRIWHLLTNQRSKTAVEAAELHADGKVSEEDLEMAFAASITKDDGAGCQLPTELDSDAAAAAAHSAAPNYQAGACHCAKYAA